jgi:hypothetical protein
MVFDGVRRRTGTDNRKRPDHDTALHTDQFLLDQTYLCLTGLQRHRSPTLTRIFCNYYCKMGRHPRYFLAIAGTSSTIGEHALASRDAENGIGCDISS